MRTIAAVSAALVSLTSLGEARADEITLPAVGARISLECDGDRRSQTVASNENGMIRFEQSRGRYVEKPTWAYPIDIYSQALGSDGNKRSYQLISGSLEGVKDLKVGASYKAVYNWADQREAFRQDHIVSVLEQKEFDAKHLGRVKVYVIKHAVASTNGDFTSDLISYYAPAMSAVVYSKSNFRHARSGQSGASECHLVSMR